MVIIPSIDLREGKVVRLRQGDYANQLNYTVDPADTARRFAQAGARFLHIVDLDGAKQGAPMQLELIANMIRAVPGLIVQVGGGVREDSHVETVLSAGAARVVIGTRAVADPDWLAVAARRHPDRLVVAIDARDGVVATHGWTQASGRLATDIARQTADLPLAGLLYTDVSRDGMMQGPNLDHTRQLVQATPIPVIASGGVGTIADIESVKGTGCWGVIVGRSLYEGTVDLSAAIAVAS